MKKFIAAVFLVFSSQYSFAIPANIEICSLEIKPEIKSNFLTETVFDIKTAPSISEFHLNLINKYYAEKGLSYSFEELKALFSDEGEESYNDLYIIEFASKKSGIVYLEVRTYPGDNPVGTVFDAATGEKLAVNSDDSYTLLTENGPFSCYETNKDKY